jgi:hypothetical protein
MARTLVAELPTDSMRVQLVGPQLSELRNWVRELVGFRTARSACVELLSSIVRAQAADIASRMRDGTMPCNSAWPAARIEAFQRWADTGLRP